MLFMPLHDATTREIVRAHLNIYFVSDNYSNMVNFHPPCNICTHNSPTGNLHIKLYWWVCLDYCPANLYHLPPSLRRILLSLSCHTYVTTSPLSISAPSLVIKNIHSSCAVFRPSADTTVQPSDSIWVFGDCCNIIGSIHTIIPARR